MSDLLVFTTPLNLPEVGQPSTTQDILPRQRPGYKVGSGFLLHVFKSFSWNHSMVSL